MDLSFGGRSYRFAPWRPSDGRVFSTPFAFDTETTAIDDARPHLVPAYVIGAAYDSSRGVFVPRDRLADFWMAHADLEVVLHNSAFDLAVVQQVLPEVDAYDRVDRDRVWDTRLLHQLLTLATAGHTAAGKGESTLETCARVYLNAELPKDTTADGRAVRTDFGRFLGRPPQDIPPEYLRYLAADAVATFGVYAELRRRTDAVLAGSGGTWGFVSADWLAGCVQKWGPLTHHVQVKAAVALAEITRAGLHVDPAARDMLVRELEIDRGAAVGRLRDHGVLVSGKGAGKALQAKLRQLARSGVPVPTTPSGAYAADAETLEELATHAPFAADLLAYRTSDKLLGSFAVKLGRPVVRPSFGVLARTGRTTSFGELNAQNLPRDDRVRHCFVPSPGHVFLDLDFMAIELAALAQANVTQFRFGSAMADRINAGDDLHKVFAGHVLAKLPEQVTKAERDRVKAINFGKPGGMGDAALRKYAKASYGIDFTEAEVKELAERWLSLFPEMRQYLTDEVDVPLALAARVGLTPAAHLEATGDGRFARHREARGRGHLPSAILGAMCLKVLGTTDPRTNRGEAYRPADVAFFWQRAADLAGELPERLATAVRDRRPSPELRRSVAGLAGEAGVFVLTGRLRAAAGFTARRNTVFQGLTSDGAKLALWRVWRAGYRVVNFVHDQLLVEVPADSDLTAHAECIKGLMIEGMRAVLPDVRVGVEYAATARWSKGAKAAFDAGGLVVSPATGR